MLLVAFRSMIAHWKMTKWCAAPNCKTGNKTEQKCSLFRVPKDIVTWKNWEKAIPGIMKLRQTDVVCEKHFNEEDMVREWVKLDANGQIITRVSWMKKFHIRFVCVKRFLLKSCISLLKVAYKCPQLKKFAVPTRFGDVPTGKENCKHGYAKRVYNFQTNSPSIVQSSSLTKPSIQEISTSINEFP